MEKSKDLDLVAFCMAPKHAILVETAAAAFQQLLGSIS